jgi:hypothetical protein
MNDSGPRRRRRKILTQEEAVTTATIKLPDGTTLGSFSPVAYFDKHMDCIRVVTHDRSVTEHRINEFYTLHEVNHRGEFDPQYVGFTIKGVKRLFAEIGLPLDRPYKLAEIIDRLVKHKPGSVMSASLSLIYNQHRGAGDLSIQVDAA